MNLFASDPSPFLSAQALCDLHLASQINETGLILSGALYRKGLVKSSEELKGRGLSGLYNPNGRFAKWAAAEPSHYGWTLQHLWALHLEWWHRFRGFRKDADKCTHYREAWARSGETPKAPQYFAADERTLHFLREGVSSVHLAYRCTLAEKYLQWGPKKAHWTNRAPPEWLEGFQGPRLVAPKQQTGETSG